MKKLSTFLESKKSKQYIEGNPENVNEFIDLIREIENSNFNKSTKISRIKIVYKLAKIHKNLKEVYSEYCNCNSTKRKLELTKNDKEVNLYVEKLKKRPRPRVVSILNVLYWTERGYSEEHAKANISEIQRKRCTSRNKESYKNLSQKLKFSLDYWTSRGYSVEEAEILRKPYVDNCKNDLESLVKKFGKELGVQKYLNRVAKYKQSMIDNLHTRRTCGYVSKESLKFFVPLYKFCRKLGMKREDICFGIEGSREFFIKDKLFEYNTGKFYDFTIKPLKIIIEYNGTYWHPRTIEEWRNPLDYENALFSDLYKEKLAKEFGMEYVVVWSDENKQNAYDRITKLVKEKYYAKH